jgi:predicted 3-demethylubiquinone-9 3-methyltransferase (glyoxalase superfamily)
MQKIVTTLWFDGRVEEAVDFYTSTKLDIAELERAYNDG